MRATPEGWPRISTAIFYDDAGAAIDWLVEAFGFEVRARIENENGDIVHSQLMYGDGLVMVGQAGLNAARPHCRSPRTLEGANTQSLCVHVEDADAHCALARVAGAEITEEPSTQDYGEDHWCDRTYGCRDPEGHHWWFLQRLRG